MARLFWKSKLKLKPYAQIMNKDGEIIIIEDDEDDRFLLEEVFNALQYPNKRVYFPDGLAALEYLHSNTSGPFIILSDINMPRLNGLELRNKLQTDAALNLKCIPYLFFSTAVNQKVVIDAYSSSAQGFFVKQTSFAELLDTITVIIEYWKRCAAPNNFT
ncbi:CheY chemotaxis protein or a CheY-like REC (receiver) domain [Dyadobacter koreensis]|uniref:CheY chemotaxis protein or a CheY-like REC (Receiver) domain n=2 Tax=Dyadobacter koreensis TaxID=408657 RepID=A0A1H6Q6H5_9BACT|nr:CheY chemotaxis protein or a CheY-like REC (receiver) domain [Dyadobacter koreensis]